MPGRRSCKYLYLLLQYLEEMCRFQRPSAFCSRVSYGV